MFIVAQIRQDRLAQPTAWEHADPTKPVKSAPASKTIAVPLECWYCGLERLGEDGNWWLVWKGKEGKLCVQKGSPDSKVKPTHTFPMDRSFEEMQVSAVRLSSRCHC